MAKYIDKDDIVDMLRRWGQEAAETNSAEAAAFEAVAYELQYFPEDDVVPVVRCKDCRYSRPRIAVEKEVLRENVVICTAISNEYITKWEDDFCSYGTLKEAPNGSDAD